MAQDLQKGQNKISSLILTITLNFSSPIFPLLPSANEVYEGCVFTSVYYSVRGMSRPRPRGEVGGSGLGVSRPRPGGGALGSGWGGIQAYT